MLHKLLLTVLLLELPDKPWIPQLAGNSQVLAGAHQRVALASLGRSWNAIRVKILHLSASDGGETASTDESVFAGDELLGDDGGGAGGKTPTAGTEGAVEDAAVFDFREEDDAVCKNRMVRLI